MKIKDATLIALVIISITTLSCLSYQCKKAKTNLTLAQNLGDSLKITRNANGSMTARISILEANSTSDFLKIKSKDSTIIWLQDVIARNKRAIDRNGSATILSTITTIHNSDSPFITGRDTVIRNDTVFIYPEYSTLISKYGKWITGNIKANKDSITYNFQSVHDYEIVIGAERHGLNKINPFSKPISFAEVTSLNPYDSVKALRTYRVVTPKANTGIKLTTGILIGIGIAKFIIWKQ